MALSEKQMQHPRFVAANHAANDAVVRAAKDLGFSVAELSAFDVQAGRVVDDLTALLLRLVNSRPS